MLRTARAFNGMIVTPHRLATGAGLALLRKGANAVEAAVAAAAVLCVVYPHMTGLGGDGFWLILPSDAKRWPPPPFMPRDTRGFLPEPIYIDACGRSAQNGSVDWYEQRGMSEVPTFGAPAALTMAGAVSGWQAALDISSTWNTGKRPVSLQKLFSDAVGLAETGYPVSAMQRELTRSFAETLIKIPGFAEQFLVRNRAPAAGARLTFPSLGKTFRRLANDGLDNFYRGSLAEEMADDLRAAGSPLTLEDFHAHRAVVGKPLSLCTQHALLFNAPPPTQGVSSLTILGILERLNQRPDVNLCDEAQLVHAIVEATKLAFAQRNRHVADPAFMDLPVSSLLSPGNLDSMAAAVSMDSALPWNGDPLGGDTIWLGVMDSYGNSVSYIQSIYHGFGSGLVLPRSGIVWNNRGLGFYFEQGRPNSLEPGKKPLHTLNPALALLEDGSVMSYGTMGGDGQPQTQAAVYARHVLRGIPLQEAICAPRWVIGRTWGAHSPALTIEENFPDDVLTTLARLGHLIEDVPPWSSVMGHAGALVRHDNGLLEGAFDPRSDGMAGCW